jgi:Tfp pilus assembly protein PilO
MALNYKSSLVRYRRYLQVAAQKPLWKASLFLSLSIILVVVLLVVAIRPTAMKIAELEAKIKTQQDLSIQLNDKIVKDQQAAGLLESYRQRLGILDEGLPIETKWKEWELGMEAVATGAGVTIQTVNIGGVQIKGDYVPTLAEKSAIDAMVLPPEVTGISISVEAGGEYGQLIQFTDLLEKTRRILVYSSAEIDKQKDGKLKLIINGKIGYAAKFLNI